MHKIDTTSQELKLASSSGAPQPGPQRDGSPVSAGAPATNNLSFNEVLFETLWPCEQLAKTVREHLDTLEDATNTLPAGTLRTALKDICMTYTEESVGMRLLQIQLAFDRINGEA